MTPQPEREVHVHIHIGGADVSQLVAEVKAANATLAKLETKMADNIDVKLDNTLSKLNQLKDHVTAEAQQSRDVTSGFQTSINDLMAERDRLQAIIDGGMTLTPEQQAKFDQINTLADETAAAVDNIVNPAPPPLDPNAPPT